MATASARWTERGGVWPWLVGLAVGLPWVVIVALVTGALTALRGTLDKAHFALVYLIVVLLASARHGRRIGSALALLCFLTFNFFLLPPYHTLVIADPRDWLVLVAFLITSFVAAQLLYRAQAEAATARERAEEVDRLSTLGAETLNVGRAEEAIEAVARVIQATLGIGSCEVYRTDPETHGFRLVGRSVRPGLDPSLVPHTDSMLGHVAEHGTAAWQRDDGTRQVFVLGGSTLDESALAQPDAQAILLPLRARDRAVGVLRLVDDRAIRLNGPQRRFAQALAYYAALGVERARLAEEAERTGMLLEADRLKDALLASVSHDLRTPLTTIKGLAQEMRVAGDERAAVIEVEADRLNRLVTDLLDLSRLNAGALQLRPELNAADDLLGAALDRLAGVPRASEIRASIEPGPPILGRFDFVHSLRALVNLIENALKYSTPGSTVEVSASRVGDRLVFRVLDRGPGIPPAVGDLIFEPFFRAAGARPDAGGAGLGLAIARRLAEAQQGGLRHEPRPGGGTVFILWLPAADLSANEEISS